LALFSRPEEGENSMTQHTRIFEVERASVDPEAGTFEAVLFTDGEASDGHILNIKGGKVPERMPLFVNHSSDPTTQLGSLYALGGDNHKVRVRGEVFTEGEGAPLEVRKDLLAKMAAGHVSRMSGRWDAADKNIKRRVNLPSDHPAFVDDSKETESRKRWGLYFEKWTAMEGSVVGLGADPQAVMRWAHDAESPECVREFWRGQVPEAQDQGLRGVLTNAARAALDAGIHPEEVADCVSAVLPFTIRAGTTARTESAIDAADVDATSDEAVVGLDDLDAPTLGEEYIGSANEREEALEELHGRVDALVERLDAMEAEPAEPAPAPVAAEEPGRVEPDEPPPSVMTPREVIAALSEGLDGAKDRVVERFRAEIEKAQGKVTHE
jgi:hypothetical protein